MKNVCIVSLAAALLGACAHAEAPRTTSAERTLQQGTESAETSAAPVTTLAGLTQLEADDDWLGQGAEDVDLDAESLAALPPAPWSESPVEALHAPEALLRSWASAENRGWCAPLASVSTEGVARAVDLDGGFGVVFDVPGQPGVGDDGEVCNDCGTGTFGVAGTMMTPAELGEDSLAPSYADGSYAEVAAEGGVASATFTVPGEGCVYQVWSFLGEEHLRALLGGMRRVTLPDDVDAVIAGL